MALLARILVVLSGCFLASLAAGLVVTLAVLVPELSDLALGPLDGNAFAAVAAFGAIFLSGFALLPAALVIAIAESLGIRTVLFYASGGALVATLLYLSFSHWQTLAFTADGFARRELEVMAGAGIVAGFVYWAVAGRNAGTWRRPAHPHGEAR